MYKLITKDRTLYYSTYEEAQKIQKYIGGRIVAIH